MGSYNDPVCQFDKYNRDSRSLVGKYHDSHESVMFVSLFGNNDTNMIDLYGI